MSIKARRKMFSIWKTIVGNAHGARIIDFGCTPDTERADSNCMLSWFNNEQAVVTLYSPEEISHLTTHFPFATVLPISAPESNCIPAIDRSFDWVSSSAVFEHVGGHLGQLEHLRECARVANGIFLTTPNRWHWLEFHTKVPFIHWLPRGIHRKILRALGQDLWAEKSHLHLTSRKDLSQIADEVLKSHFTYSIHSVWSLGMPSNLVLIARRLEQAPKPS